MSRSLLKMDMYDAFVECLHNKVKAELADGTQIVVERVALGADYMNHVWHIHKRTPQSERYACVTVFMSGALHDMLDSLTAPPIDVIWLPLEQWQQRYG